MSGIDNIPAETRWAVATQALTGAITASGAAYEQVVGEEGYKQVATAIWREGGKGSGQLVESMGLPRPTDAPGLYAVTETLIQLIMGPEFAAEVTESSPERVVARVTSCPFANRAAEQGVLAGNCITSDHAWCLGLADHFGLKLEHDITTAMPLGDQYCTAVFQLQA